MMSLMCTRRATARHRRGAVMIAALVCLMLVTMLVTAMLQSALNSRRQLRMEKYARQTTLLLQAGVGRAQQQLTGDDNYDGETVHVEIPGRTDTDEGEVEISAEPVNGQSLIRVQVTARYPLESPYLVQRTIAFTFPHSTR